MNIKISFSEPDLGLLEKQYLNEALNSTWIGGKGDFIDRFEDKFAKYIGVKYAVTCSSGTAALLLAYHACGMNAESKVIVPDTTFVATSNMAFLFTRDVVTNSVKDDTWTLGIDDIKGGYVVGVHLYGNPVDMGSLHKDKFIFIEDCAQSIGSRFKGKMVGSFGLASCFSFHSAKTITTGEGGMVCTNEKVIADRVRHLKNQSMLEPYKHDMIGYNLRMTNLQAAIGLAQLERIDEFIEKKRLITDRYNKYLSPNFQRQKDTRKSFVVHWANAYKHPKAKDIRAKLLEIGIDTRPGFLGEDTIVFPCSTKLTQTELDLVIHEANIYA